MPNESESVEISGVAEISDLDFLGIDSTSLGFFKSVIRIFTSARAVSESAIDLGKKTCLTEVFATTRSTFTHFLKKDKGYFSPTHLEP